jgi:hypothetical protein
MTTALRKRQHEDKGHAYFQWIDQAGHLKEFKHKNRLTADTKDILEGRGFLLSWNRSADLH